MSTITIPAEEARGMFWGDEDEYKIVEDEIIDNRRWSIDHRLVIQRVSDGEFFAGHYSVGATEMQDERPWEYEDAVFHRVMPVKKVVVTYERALH